MDNNDEAGLSCPVAHRLKRLLASVPKTPRHSLFLRSIVLPLSKAFPSPGAHPTSEALAQALWGFQPARDCYTCCWCMLLLLLLLLALLGPFSSSNAALGSEKSKQWLGTWLIRGESLTDDTTSVSVPLLQYPFCLSHYNIAFCALNCWTYRCWCRCLELWE